MKLYKSTQLWYFSAIDSVYPEGGITKIAKDEIIGALENTTGVLIKNKVIPNITLGSSQLAFLTFTGTTSDPSQARAVGPMGFQGAQGPEGLGHTIRLYTSGPQTANADERILADTTSGAWQLNLPASPSDGDRIVVQDPATSWNTNNLTVSGNGNTIRGDSTDTLDVDDSWIEYTWDNTNSYWLRRT